MLNLHSQLRIKAVNFFWNFISVSLVGFLTQLIDLNHDLVVVFFCAPHEATVSRLRLESLIQHVLVLVFDLRAHDRNALLHAFLDA